MRDSICIDECFLSFSLSLSSLRMTMESSTNGAVTFPCTSVSEYAGHATIFSWMLDYRVLLSSRVKVAVSIRFTVWLISCFRYGHVIICTARR